MRCKRKRRKPPVAHTDQVHHEDHTPRGHGPWGTTAITADLRITVFPGGAASYAPVYPTLCGRHAPRITNDATAVTCKECSRRLALATTELLRAAGREEP